MNREARTCIGRQSVGDVARDCDAFHAGTLREQSVFLPFPRASGATRDFRKVLKMQVVATFES